MTARLLVGLDVGTTSSKAVIFTEAGDAVSQGRAGTPWTATPTGAELDPAELLAAAVDALGRALAGAPEGVVAGVGVASMGETGVLLDRSGTPVGPAIAWHDTRDRAELAELESLVGHVRFAETTGLPLRHQWSLTKHRWLRRHHPETAAAVRRLNVADWVVRGLGGEESCELSLASRTGWLRLQTRDWWDEALDWAGAGAALMPPLVTSGDALGTASSDSGLERLAGAVLTVAGHDHQAAAVGAGALGEGDELDSCGTAEALVRSVAPGIDPATVGRLAAGGITVGWHTLAGRWCLLGGTTGGLTLQKVLAELGVGTDGLAELDRLAAALPAPGAPGLPRPPAEATPAATWRAALEAVTDEAAAIHDAMSAVSGGHRAMVVTGGWSRSTALMQVKARRFGPLRHPDVAEAGARGAALLAGLAAGVYSGTADFPALA